GKPSRIFGVPRDLITARSEFFRNALNSRWVESNENMVTLPANDLELFQKYLHVVYLNTAPVGEDVDVHTVKNGNDGSRKRVKRSAKEIDRLVSCSFAREFDTIIDLYILSDHL
ncbi:hypothetical protein BU23DRAFT_453962, partial [Bimuria novae-zelandiae CBS 107.79]